MLLDSQTNNSYTILHMVVNIIQRQGDLNCPVFTALLLP